MPAEINPSGILTDTVIGVIAASALLEIILFLFFKSAYYKAGIVLFKKRLPANTAARARVDFGLIEDNVNDTLDCPLKFEALAHDCLAFKQPFYRYRLRRYLYMRGYIDVDHRRGEVRVVAIASWWSALLPLGMLFIVGLKIGLLVLAGLALAATFSYMDHRHELMAVVRAVRWQLMDHAALEQVQSWGDTRSQSA